MRATARSVDGFTHEVEVDGHTITVDEPAEAGGHDRGPSPQRLLTASLASCTAITMRMYAQRKGWDVDGLEVDVEAKVELPAHFDVVLHLPSGLNDEQAEKLEVIAGKCPVHRVLAADDVEVTDRVERG